MLARVGKYIERYAFRLICSAVMLLLSIYIIATGASSSAAFAAENESSYSDVMIDLRKDDEFNVNDWPADSDNYSIDVVTVAESVDGELFVYVYNPSALQKPLYATSINISTGINDNFYPLNYELEFLNSSGVFGKYLVKDFTVLDDALRYYSIPSIFREFDEDIDEGLPDYVGNTIDEKAFEVGEQFTASTLNGEISYTSIDTETVEILDPYVGMLRYSDGFWLWNFPYTDSHFIAFSTDYPIDKLMEADISYVTRSKTMHYPAIAGAMPTTTYGDPVDNTKTIYAEDEAGNSADGWFAKTYTWERIQTTAEFIESEDLTESAQAEVDGTQWVLRFLETEYTEQYFAQGGSAIYSTGVSQVTILRLKFEVDGNAYNLGAVMDKQSGDGLPDNNNVFELDWSNYGSCLNSLSTVIAIIALLVLIIILWPILPYIIKMIVAIITLPFKAIAALYRAIKNRGKDSSEAEKPKNAKKIRGDK